MLLTGHDGYIGSVMGASLRAAGHEVVGVDMLYFSKQMTEPKSKTELQGDIRDIDLSGLEGTEAIIHLAALSNDSLGQINPELTYEINHKASVRLAKLAKEAGVRRFLYASTCSVYGVAKQDELATEDSPMHPLTPYAISKVRVEEDLSKMADGIFSPVFLRNATAYGWSPNFRSDLVVNNLACWAYTTGEIRIMSDGTPWRPVVHVLDIANAFASALAAPREAIHNQAFNVGIYNENYQISELADIVREGFADCRVIYDENSGSDPRSYRVDFSKITEKLSEYNPAWNVRKGVTELRAAFDETGLTCEDFTGPKYVRLARLMKLMEEGQLDSTLRWVERAVEPTAQAIRR